MQVRELITKIGFKVDDKGLRRAEAGIASLKTAALALGAAIVSVGGSLFGLAKSAANAGDNALKAAQKTGLSVESYQKLAYAAELADVSTEQLGVGMAQLSKKMLDASEGGEENAKLFKSLGVSVKDAKGQMLGGEAVLTQLSDVFQRMPDGPRKTALAMEVFGKSGMQLIPLLNGGGQAIKDLGAELEAFGGVIGEDIAKKSEAFNDNITRMHRIVSSVKNAIGAALVPVLQELTDDFLGWVSANRELIKTKIVEWSSSLKETLVDLIQRGKRVVVWIGEMVDRFGGLKAVLGFVSKLFLAFIAAKVIYGIYALVSAIGAVTAALFAMEAAAIVPLLIAAAIAAIAAAVYLVYDDVKAFLEGRENMFGPIYEWAIRTYHNLMDAWNAFKAFNQDFWLVFVTDLWPYMQKLGEVLTWPYKLMLKAISSVVEAHNNLVDKLSAATGIDVGKYAKIDTSTLSNLASAISMPDLSSLDDIIRFSTKSISARAAEIQQSKPGFVGPVNNPSLYAGMAPTGAPGAVSKKQDNKFNLNQNVTVNATTSGDPAQIGETVKNIVNSETGKMLRSSLKALQGLL